MQFSETKLGWKSAEKRPFSFDSHFATIERRKVVIQTAFFRTIPCLKKDNFKDIGLIQSFDGKQNQSVLQNWVSQSVNRIVILTMCHVSEFHKILDSNYTRIVLSIYVKFTLGKWLGTRQKSIQNRSQKTQNHASSNRVRHQKYHQHIGI